ncbi:MAG: hypothetical protein Q9213_005772 [Squamulea squamosa]
MGYCESHTLDIRRGPPESYLRTAIKKGLTSDVKGLPSMLLWDDQGLAHYEAVKAADTRNYYPARRENEIIDRHSDEIARIIPAATTLVELGSGNVDKTSLILSAVERVQKSIRYFALDLSYSGLSSSIIKLRKKFPVHNGNKCHGLLGTYDDFHAWLMQKPQPIMGPITILWMGNSIGNLSAPDASAVLRNITTTITFGQPQVIIGVDGCRDQAMIEMCYDPAGSVTHDFLMNGLEQANVVLGSSVFSKTDWTLLGFYDDEKHAWVDYYVAKRNIKFQVADSCINISEGERIHAISSAKWTQREVESIASDAGCSVTQAWKDKESVYGVEAGAEGRSLSLRNISEFAVDALYEYFTMGERTTDPISEEDLQKLIRWNAEPLYPKPHCVHDLIDEQHLRDPRAIAVDSWDGELSYEGLDAHSSRLAVHLVELGVTAEQIVPLCFQKSMWAVVSMLAVLKAGAAFTFIEPSHPIERTRHVLQDVRASVLLCSASVSSLLKGRFETLNHTIEVTHTFVHCIDISPSLLLSVSQPDHAAVVLFTSGSTGTPKGIVQEHHTAALSAQTCARIFGIRPRTRVLQWASYSFDMSIIDMLMTLVSGGCICIPSEHMRLNDLERAVREMRIECVAMTPSTAQILKRTQLPDLRTLVFGGEAVHRKHLEGWQRDLQIINGYGPGEASVCIAGTASIDRPSNIGRAVGSVAWIVDEASFDRLVPIGDVGEILIEGPLLARGYLNDVEKTAASFIEDSPWLNPLRPRIAQKRRLYRTGDLARYHVDGTIEFCGRKDSQIKLRGQRIEPGEIEYHLSQHLGENVALAVDLISPAQGRMASELAAFVGLEGTAVMSSAGKMPEHLTAVESLVRYAVIADVQDLGKQLSTVLPPYMIPSYLIPLTFLPLTVSGKMDRKLLRHLGSSLTAEKLQTLTHEHENRQAIQKDEEITQMQATIAELWRNVLPTHPIDIHQNDGFIKLGGDSVNAMQLAGAAAARSISLTTADIFQHPTLSGMSLAALATVDVKSPCNESAGYLPLRRHGPQPSIDDMYCPALRIKSQDKIEDIVEATDLQAFMVSCGLLKTHGYINYFAFDLAGPIVLSRLEDACRKLVARHSVLRTAFAIHNARIYQVLRKEYDPKIMQYSSQEETQAVLSKLCTLDLSYASQLGEDIVRFLVVARGPNRHTLIMRMSHAQFDGTSLGLIYRNLRMLYANETLPPAPQFIDWARASNDANTSEEEDYWRQLLKGSSMTSILDHSKPSYQYVINDRVSLTVSFTSLQSKSITVATLVKAAWSVVLAELSSSRDVVFANAVAGRNLPLPNIDQIVGDCNNAVLVRVKLLDTTTVYTLLQQIQNQLIAAIPYETIGCRQLVENCTDWPRWTRYSTSVNHQNYTAVGEDTFRMGQAECIVSFKDLESDRRDIQIYSYPLDEDGMLKLTMAFCDAALEKGDVRRILQRLGETVKRLSEDVDALITLRSNPIESNIPLQIPAVGNGEIAKRDCPGARASKFAFSLLRPETIVDTVWGKMESLLRNEGSLNSGSLDEGTPFYSLGGDLVYAAQLSAWYEQEGILFSIEELIENPTKRLQREILARL